MGHKKFFELNFSQIYWLSKSCLFLNPIFIRERTILTGSLLIKSRLFVNSASKFTTNIKLKMNFSSKNVEFFRFYNLEYLHYYNLDFILIWIIIYYTASKISVDP